MGRATARWVLLAVAVGVALAAAAASAVPLLSGEQPWGATLADNMLFAKSIPFAIGLGLLVGVLRGLAARAPGEVERRPTDGAIRRFRPGTVVMHWVAALGFVLALATGAWQYLKGVLDVGSPVAMPLVYRLHYVGAGLLLVAGSSFLTYWWLRADAAATVPRGQRIRHLRGLAHELPGPLGGLLAGTLGLNMRLRAPEVERFTYYEKVVSFPGWIVLLGLVVVTGLLKAMRYVFPVPGELLWWASALHVAVFVLLAAKLLDHLRYVVAPHRWPLFQAMLTTWIGERYVELRHPGWHRAIQRRRSGSAPAPSAPPAAPTAPPVSAAGSPAEGGGA